MIKKLVKYKKYNKKRKMEIKQKNNKWKKQRKI